MTLPVVFTANGPSGYNLTKSLRFRSSASAYLNRTPASASNRQKFTISVWYKAGKIGVDPVNANILNAGGDGSSLLISGTGAFGSTYNNSLIFREAGTTLFYWPMVFRDPSAWYHIVFAMDTTQATASNRAKLYVNGVDQGAFLGTAITQNTSTSINNNSAHYINTFNGTFYPSDLYYAEYNFVDGQQLTPSSFGSTNSLTGVWQPAKYTGTYGTNGFYLPFTNTTSTTTIGYDFSGNGNNWTTNNLSLTTGSTYDSMTDVPTLTSATTANYCVVNPLDKGATATVSNGNLRLNNAFTGSPYPSARCSVGVSSGKYYWEITCTTISGDSPSVGIATSQASVNNYLGVDAYSWVYILATGNKGTNGNTALSYGASVSSGDIVGVALDMDAGTLTFYKNNTSQGTAFTGLTGTMFPAGFAYNNSILDFNFGQQGFAYTPPTGFVALNIYNLPTSTIVKGNTVMDATLYTGNGTAVTVTNAGTFKPDLVWGKSRSNAISNYLVDSVRGVSKALSSDRTDAEDNAPGYYVTSFNSNGFNIGLGTGLNTNGATYVGWQWQAGQGVTLSNTNGSITSTVSVNTSAGFSVITYTGTGSTATIGHGLGVAPSMIIVKPRNLANSWVVYHSALGQTCRLYLESTAANSPSTTVWNNTSPTSSVFSIAGNETANNGGNFVAYCWAEIAGFSKFGSYTGNGSTDGPFVYTGFRPKFVMFKRTDSTGSWHIFDSSRNPYNLTDLNLYANGTNTDTQNNQIDLLSNGFKCRSSDTDDNASGGTVIYMAFAENPFKNALAR